MKKIILYALIAGAFFTNCVKQWPSDALYQIKQNAGISLDCEFLSAMLGRDMSNEYPQKLLQAYKNEFPNYADFENYTITYVNSSDPIRVNILKSMVRNCDFSAVWNILEKGSSEVRTLKNMDSYRYNRLKSITINNLQSSFDSIEKFVDELTMYPSNADSKIKRVAEQSIAQLNSSYNTAAPNSYNHSYNNSPSYNSSQTINIPMNKIETNSHIWRVVSINITNGGTIVQKQVTPKASTTWISSDTGEFIEDAETGRKYYITSSSIGFNSQKIIYGTNPYSFSETYPQLPSTVRYINISSGSQYYIRNVRIR